MKKLTLILLISFAFYNCGKKQKKESFEDIKSIYLDYSSRDDLLGGGVKMD